MRRGEIVKMIARCLGAAIVFCSLASADPIDFIYDFAFRTSGEISHIQFRFTPPLLLHIFGPPPGPKLGLFPGSITQITAGSFSGGEYFFDRFLFNNPVTSNGTVLPTLVLSDAAIPRQPWFKTRNPARALKLFPGTYQGKMTAVNFNTGKRAPQWNSRFTITATPEPAGVVLLATTGIVIGLIALRRRSKNHHT